MQYNQRLNHCCLIKANNIHKEHYKSTADSKDSIRQDDLLLELEKFTELFWNIKQEQEA